MQTTLACRHFLIYGYKLYIYRELLYLPIVKTTVTFKLVNKTGFLCFQYFLHCWAWCYGYVRSNPPWVIVRHCQLLVHWTGYILPFNENLFQQGRYIFIFLWLWYSHCTPPLRSFAVLCSMPILCIMLINK
jgi:hypothetical protein